MKKMALIFVLAILHSPHPGPPPLGEGVFCSSPQRGEAGRGAIVFTKNDFQSVPFNGRWGVSRFR